MKKKPAIAREDRRAKAVTLAATGMPQRDIGRVLGVSAHTVNNDLCKPKSQEELRAIRDQIRTHVIERTQAGLIQGTMDVVGQAIDAGDAKSLELATRAAVNLDKLTASASGESQRVEVTGMPPVTNVDLKVLITDLLGHAKRLGA